MSWLALKRFVVCVGMLACFQVSTPAFARPVQVMLDDEVTPPFEPENTFFLLELPGQEVQRVRAVAVSPFTSADGRGRSWTVGAEITIPEELKEFRYSILVLGPAQQFFVVPERTWSGALPSIEQLRALLLEVKATLQSKEQGLTAALAEVRRLRADADAIANLGRIVEVEAQANVARGELESIERDRKNLRELLAQVKSAPPPKNYARREVELTSQIAELAAAAKSAEAGEVQRKAAEQRRAELVNEAASEDLPALEVELERVRTEREALEAAEVR